MLVRLYREHQLRRGRLPRLRAIEQLPRAREGVFRLGVAAGGGELAWDPWGIDAPHMLVAGTTESGKTRLMEMMALVALDWGWECEVIDFKGGGDYWAATSRGAAVHSDPKAAVAALKRAASDIATRNATMRTAPVYRERDDGRVVEDRATTFRDLPGEIRAEHGWRARLMLIDETASIIADKKAGGPEALRSAVQLGRSAGVHIVLAMQRPDASLLEGFVKHNVQARILLGSADAKAEEMVIGAGAAGELDDAERRAVRPPGRGLASGVGGRPIARFHAFLLARDRYLPFPSDSGAPPASGGAGERPPEGEGPDDSGPSLTPFARSHPHTFGMGVPPPSRPSVRSVLVGPIARVGLRLAAARLAFRPLRSGPFARDLELAEDVKRSDGYACRTCGHGPPVEADHRRPLWAGGQDRRANMWTLCRRCHRAKTNVETKVRALRGRSGFGRLRLPRYPLWGWIGAACIAFGLADGRWTMHALIVLVALALGPALVRHYVIPKPFRRSKGGGLDGVSTWDAKLERQASGYFGAVARGYYGTRIRVVTARLAFMGASVAYLLGAFGPGLVP